MRYNRGKIVLKWGFIDGEDSRKLHAEPWPLRDAEGNRSDQERISRQNLRGAASKARHRAAVRRPLHGSE